MGPNSVLLSLVPFANSLYSDRKVDQILVSDRKDRQTDRRTDGRKEGRKDRKTERQKDRRNKHIVGHLS